MKPAEALTEGDRLKLQEDNFPPNAGVWSILLNDGHVSLHRPNGGWVEIPSEQFKRLAEWYLTDQPAVVTEIADER